MSDRRTTRRATTTSVILSGIAALCVVLVAWIPASAATPTSTTTTTATDTVGEPEPLGEPATPTTLVADPTATTAPDAPDDPAGASVPTTAPTATTPDDGSDDAPTVVRLPTSAAVRDSDIPIGSIVIALAVLIAVGASAIALGRRPAGRDVTLTDDAGPPPAPEPDTGASDTTTLQFLLELGEALMDAGDSVGHVEAMLRKIASVHGIRQLGVLVLPSVLVLSVEHDETVTTELRTGGGNALRLDQIDDVLRLELAAEHGEITPAEGRRELARIRRSEPPFQPSVVLAGYVVAAVGLAMILRAEALELVLAAVLGSVVGGLRMATWTRPAAYQAFWPLIAAGTSSAVVFATARVVDDLAVFPALIAPLIFFLPGGLLTIGVLELATGQPVSGASRVAAGGMRLVLLAIGILAGARLVGVPGGDIRAGGDGVVAVLEPWAGVALFGIGVAWFYGARGLTLVWILVVLYASYSGQVLGGLFFGSSLSAFFGAVTMTPVALFVARQRSGPTPLVTFLPGFWLLVPGALGLEGVTRLISDDGDVGADALITAATSMVGISLGVLLGLVISGADPGRPWSIARSSRPTGGRAPSEQA